MAPYLALCLRRKATVPTLPTVIGVILVVAGTAVSVLAFPPFGPGWLIVAGIAMFLTGLRKAESRKQGLILGAIYGFGFFAGLMWWLSELGLIAMIPLVLLQGGFFAVYGWWLSRYNDRSPMIWYLLAAGGWGVMELVRYHFPFNGLEWGAAGYALSDQAATRLPAAAIGTSGLTILVVLVAGLVALLATRQFSWWLLIPLPTLLLMALSVWWLSHPEEILTSPDPVYIVQGSTPCPFEHCPPDERLRTFEQHLELTRTIEGEAFLVIWSEGSTGSFNADPVLNSEIRELIGAEARRLNAWFLVGSDRPVSETEWINANVLFNPDGEIVAEYRKQHPVPFGEYIPFRPLFDWIPTLDQVPRDMIPGDGPVVFDLDGTGLGSVISFEGGFSRYARQHVQEGAGLIVVATNESSYGTTPASDQFIGMTRMRATELGIDVVHSAVTGRSVFISHKGELRDPISGLGMIELIEGVVASREPSPYARYGDFVIWAAALIAIVTWWRARSLVGSGSRISEEE